MLRISFKNRLGRKSQLLTFINNHQLKTLFGKNSICNTNKMSIIIIHKKINNTGVQVLLRSNEERESRMTHPFFYHFGQDVSLITSFSRQCKRPMFHSCLEKIPWRRKQQPTPVSLPGKARWATVQRTERLHFSLSFSYFQMCSQGRHSDVKEVGKCSPWIGSQFPEATLHSHRGHQ